jgi:hypothetical protein
MFTITKTTTSTIPAPVALAATFSTVTVFPALASSALFAWLTVISLSPVPTIASAWPRRVLYGRREERRRPWLHLLPEPRHTKRRLAESSTSTANPRWHASCHRCHGIDEACAQARVWAAISSIA